MSDDEEFDFVTAYVSEVIRRGLDASPCDHCGRMVDVDQEAVVNLYSGQFWCSVECADDAQAVPEPANGSLFPGAEVCRKVSGGTRWEQPSLF